MQRFVNPNLGKSALDPDYDEQFDAEEQYQDYLDEMYEDRW